MCAAIGGDHICTYAEVLEAEGKGELASIADGTEFWLHRVSVAVACLGANCPNTGGMGMSAPGAGARCNDWTYPTNHISDGEFGVKDSVNPAPGGNSIKNGNIIYYFDDDGRYSGDPTDPYECGGVASNSDGTPGCAGSCGPEGIKKAILCCNPVCIP